MLRKCKFISKMFLNTSQEKTLKEQHDDGSDMHQLPFECVAVLIVILLLGMLLLHIP